MKRIFQSIPWIFIALFLVFINKIYFDRIVGFSFGDEWNSFVLGYFMLHGRHLYSQIFTNHQMLIADISFFLQIIFHPNSLYKLVFIHRMSVIIFSFVFDLFLLFRFKKKVLPFVIIYEIGKYYVFGSIFLAESFIAYPLVYLFLLGFQKIIKKQVFDWEILISAILTWFVFFMREPYMPLCIVLYVSILWRYPKKRMIISSILLFIFLSFITVLTVPLYWYVTDVYLFNFLTVIPFETKSSGTAGIGIFKIFFYPLTIFVEGKWNFFRELLILCSINYVIFNIILFLKKRYKLISYSYIILTLASVRIVPPGTLFYEAFHMTVWYALFCATISVLFFEIIQIKKHSIRFISFILLISTLLFGFLPSSYVWEKVDKNTVFTINYAQYYSNGQAIKLLASPKDTLFADLWDYLIFTQAGLDSSYKFAVYTFVMQGYKPFQDARIAMFKTNPPDFYYTYCPKNVYTSDLLPNFVANQYVQLLHNNAPSCLYMKKTKLSSVSSAALQQIKDVGFSLPQ